MASWLRLGEPLLAAVEYGNQPQLGSSNVVGDDVWARFARSYPAIISNAVAAASRMWRSRTASGLSIKDERTSNHFVSKVPAEIHGRP
jgi:hypothetical protein